MALVFLCAILARKALWPDSGRRSLRLNNFQRRRHERKLNTINENPQMTQIYQIFLCVLRVLRG